MFWQTHLAPFISFFRLFQQLTVNVFIKKLCWIRTADTGMWKEHSANWATTSTQTRPESFNVVFRPICLHKTGWWAIINISNLEWLLLERLLSSCLLKCLPCIKLHYRLNNVFLRYSIVCFDTVSLSELLSTVWSDKCQGSASK